MSSKRRSLHHSKVTANSRAAQRGSSSTVVLLLALLVVVAAVVYLFSQMGKFKNGRSADNGIVLETAPEDAEVPGAASPTAEKKKSFLSGLFEKKQPTPTPDVAVEKPVIAPSPTPITRALPQGEQPFTITQGKEMVGPLFVKGVVSDFATARDVKQTVKIYFDKTRPAQSLTATLQTDTKTTPIIMTKQADQEGLEVWMGEWVLLDTNDINMSMNFMAVNQSGKSSAGVAVR